MQLVLEDKYNGRVIADAFKRATAFEKTDKKKWVAEESNLPLGESDKFKIVDGSIVADKIGIAVHRKISMAKRRWIFWGEERIIWERDSDCGFFVLAPIFESEEYSQVNVYIEKAIEDGSDEIYIRFAHSSQEFKRRESLFASFLQRFLQELK